MSCLAGAAALVLAAATPVGAAVSDRPLSSAGFDGTVRAVAYAGDTVYVGGEFTTVTDDAGSHPRAHVAALDAATGRVLPFNPGADGSVWAITVAGDRVYLGGEFTRVGGRPRTRLAGVSTSGAVTDFAPALDRPVRALAADGQRLFAGGSFQVANGTPRGFLAAFELATGRLTGWDPVANHKVFALVATADRVLVGGRFTAVNGRAGSGFLTAVDPVAGRLTAFDPRINAPVHDVAVTTNRVYAAVDGAGGRLRAFTAAGESVFELVTNGGVNAVAVLDDLVYFGGHFDTACAAADLRSRGGCPGGEVSRRKLAAVTPAGRLDAWAPQANSPTGVLAMHAAPALRQLAVGGAFTTMNRGRTSALRFARFSSF